jgi:2-amino-4-hydroxy-6-hydroxymethyldihydropteridine diphosphokinase
VELSHCGTIYPVLLRNKVFGPGTSLMILIALGANLPHPEHGVPPGALAAALRLLDSAEFRVTRRSRWYESPADPPSDQPPYVNGVAVIEAPGGPEALLALLLDAEARLGRVRGQRNEARTVDLDLLAFDGRVHPSEAPGALELPHPRMHARPFVLLPLAEVAPGWQHPVTGRTVEELIAALGTAAGTARAVW